MKLVWVMYFLPIERGDGASLGASFLDLQTLTLFLDAHTVVPVCLCPDPLFEGRQQSWWTEDCLHTLILTKCSC